ncbi:hypothetical protein G7046_g7940 [Stylonectria norvegica]|nr:hypothetical protein G7046_g7940 [Stylonectria norvegica]
MTDNIAQRPRPPPHRRRDKVPLSCGPCRNRKYVLNSHRKWCTPNLARLRCDRQHPCAACSRRGLADSCNYATTSSSFTTNAARSVAPQSFAPRQPISLHDRISELESLVVTVIEGRGHPSPPALMSPISSSLSFAEVFPEIRTTKKFEDGAASLGDHGTLSMRESGTSYVQSAHWEAILTKIRGLKEDLVTDSKAAPGSHLFYGPNRHVTRDQILAAVPLRPVVDRLMALHFDSYIITPYLIHSKKFLKEYEGFWEEPSTTSIAWIGLMFSMLYIAAQLRAFTINSANGQAESLEAEYLTMKDGFREKAVQCLILARYTTGGPYILETLITVLTGESILLKDGATDGWLCISTILHLAMRMGYHRDPDHFPDISPFEGEMRRRIWTTILQLDLALSLEMGLPRSATDTHIDTKQPLNLRDCDFEEDTTEMPPPRPETEWTPVLPLIAKARLTSALGMICNVNAGIIPPSCDEVIRVDALLQDVHNHAIPAVLRWEATPDSVTDSPSLVIQRVSVETTYLKSRILLHRRALIGSPARQPQETDAESMRICLNSAVKILSFQQMLHEESQPFGRLSRLRWKVVHIFNQDVLLATSVLCVYLQDLDKFEMQETRGHTTWSATAEDIRQRLTISHKIWLDLSATSAEASKVAKALNIVLGSTEMSTEDDTGPSHYDFLMDFNAMLINGFSAMLNN